MRTVSRLLALVCVSVALTARAETTQTRALSLDECLQLALRHNLGLRIERYYPQLALYDLSAAYAGYDPEFQISGQHDFAKSGDTVIQGGFPVPGAESDTDSFRSSLSGLLPFGLTYSLQGSASDRYGTSFFVDTNGVVTPRTFENSRASASFTLTQPLLKNFWIDDTRRSIAVARNRVKFSEQGLRQQIINLVTAVETAYYDLIFAQENVKVQEKALQLAERLFQENKKRVEVGVLAPLDEKQAESQVAARKADLLSAQRTLEVQQNVLKNLITDNYAEWHELDVQPAETLSAPPQLFDLQDSWSIGLTARPDLAQLKLDLEQAGIQLKYYRNQLWPQLDLFGTYGQGGTASEFSGAFGNVREANEPFHTYGALLTIPLSNLGARNRYKSGKVAVEQAVLGLKKLEQDIMVQIDDAIKQAQASFERVDATRAARQYAEAALEAEQKKLESGKSTSFFVLQLQRDLTAARSEEIRALADYNKALATVALREGSTLERRKIDLEIK